MYGGSFEEKPLNSGAGEPFDEEIDEKTD